MKRSARQRSVALACLAFCAASGYAQVNPAAAPKATLTPSISAPQRVADTFFYLQADPTGTHPRLMARKRKEAAGRTLLDLDTLSSGQPASSFQIQPSWDGKYVAVGISLGREGYSIRIVDVAAAAVLPDSITHSFDGGAAWSDTNNAFFYRKFQQAPSGAPATAIFTNMRAYRHKLGDDPSHPIPDEPVFGPDINTELHLPTVGAVNAFPLPGTTLLLAVQSSAPAALDSFWVSDTQVAGHLWRKIIDHSDEVFFEFSSRGATLYFITRRNAPSGRLIAFDAAHEDISNARQILPASDLQLADRNRDGVLCAKDALYVYGHRGGVSSLLRVPYDDPTHSAEIALPFAGVIADVSGDPFTPGLVFSLAGDTHPPTVYEYDPSTKRLTDTRLTW